MRSLVVLAVRRRITVLMAALAVVAFGIVGYQRLALDLFPDITYPSFTIQTDFPDTAPQEVENLVTRPVEEAVGVLRGLQSIHSVSRSGVSEVTLEFDWDSDMDALSMDVRDKLDRLILPDGAEDPIVLRFDPSLDPILRVALTGPDPLTDIRRIADKKLKQQLETLRGIASAQLQGGLEEEIQIDVDQERLAALGIPMERVRSVVGASNINLPGGSLRSADSQYLIRTLNEFDSMEEIEDLILRQDEAAPVRLGDVASVYRGAKQREEITRVGGRECVELAIYKEGDANTVTVARKTRARLAGLAEDLPPGYEVTTLFDQSRLSSRRSARCETRRSSGACSRCSSSWRFYGICAAPSSSQPRFPSRSSRPSCSCIAWTFRSTSCPSEVSPSGSACWWTTRSWCWKPSTAAAGKG